MFPRVAGAAVAADDPGMQAWALPSPAGADTTAALIGCLGRPDYPRRTLAVLNESLPVAWWTVYRVFDDQPPTLLAQASHAVPDIALDCFRIYRDGLYRDDHHFAEACARAGRETVMTHCREEDFGRAHRELIYQPHALSERLSLVCAAPGGQLAVNLYRHRAQPRFAPAELDRVLALAPALLAVAERHAAMAARAAAPVAEAPLAGAPAAPPGCAGAGVRTGAGAALRARCPALTAREVAVCERLLAGLTFEGIAADLGISVATAKTYRNRAFERLGIHHRNALYALALPH